MQEYMYWEYLTRLGWPFAFLLAVFMICLTARSIFNVKAEVTDYSEDNTVFPTWSETVTKEYLPAATHSKSNGYNKNG